jgi:hypothetical protein
MGSDAWIVGDVPRPLIEVLDPVTKQRLPLANPPEVTIIAPDGTVTGPTEAEHAAEVVGAFEAPFELTQVGPYLGIAESPAPYKDVTTFTLYANPPA